MLRRRRTTSSRPSRPRTRGSGTSRSRHPSLLSSFNGTLPGGQDDNPTVESSFFTQGVGAIFDASPGVSVGLRTNPEFEDYFSIGIPAVDGAPLEPRSPGVPGKG